MAAPRSPSSPTRPTRYRPEREFGFAVGAVLCALGGWWLYRGRFPTAAPLAVGAGSLLALLAALFPASLVFPRRLWMALAEAMSFVVTRLVLAVVFFGLVTPIGLLRKALGRDPLRRRAPPAPSYWLPYSARQADPRHYEKMY